MDDRTCSSLSKGQIERTSRSTSDCKLEPQSDINLTNPYSARSNAIRGRLNDVKNAWERLAILYRSTVVNISVTRLHEELRTMWVVKFEPVCLSVYSENRTTGMAKSPTKPVRPCANAAKPPSCRKYCLNEHRKTHKFTSSSSSSRWQARRSKSDYTQCLK